jgi:hypothetical protein
MTSATLFPLLFSFSVCYKFCTVPCLSFYFPESGCSSCVNYINHTRSNQRLFVISGISHMSEVLVCCFPGSGILLQICPGRTWQSMKEHFIKKIIPNIKSYHLSKEELHKFQKP